MTVWSSLRACGIGLTGITLLATGLAGSASVSAPVELAAAAPNPVAASGWRGLERHLLLRTGPRSCSRARTCRRSGNSSIVVTTPKAERGGRRRGDPLHGGEGLPLRAVLLGARRQRLRGHQPRRAPGVGVLPSGSSPVVGRTTGGGTKLALHRRQREGGPRAVPADLGGFKAEGWDGVMFDRGQAATQHAKDTVGRSVWDRKSSCTEDPYKQGATVLRRLRQHARTRTCRGPRGDDEQRQFSVRHRSPDAARPRNVSCRAAQVAEVQVPLGHLAEGRSRPQRDAGPPEGQGLGADVRGQPAQRERRSLRPPYGGPDHHGQPSWGAEPDSGEGLLPVVADQALRPRGRGEHR